jgi:hypothetical protein
LKWRSDHQNSLLGSEPFWIIYCFIEFDSLTAVRQPHPTLGVVASRRSLGRENFVQGIY